MLKELEKLIDFIQIEYIELTNKWEENKQYMKFHLKNNEVYDLLENKILLEAIFNYREFINQNNVKLLRDFIVENEKIQEKIQEYLDRIIAECGKDVSISTHMIQAEGENWEAVCKADHFFKDVEVIDGIEKFIKLIKKDRKLQGVDIAKYILSKIKCTQLKLQKLVYLCFADYLCETEKELFIDDIYAFKYGPVVDTVYKRYKSYGYKPIEEEKEDINSTVSEMPAKSRILFAEEGTEKLISIDKTLKKYGDLTAGKLVELTHRENTPWTVTSKGKWIFYSKLKLEVIKEYHKYEII